MEADLRRSLGGSRAPHPPRQPSLVKEMLKRKKREKRNCQEEEKKSRKEGERLKKRRGGRSTDAPADGGKG